VGAPARSARLSASASLHASRLADFSWICRSFVCSLPVCHGCYKDTHQSGTSTGFRHPASGLDTFGKYVGPNQGDAQLRTQLEPGFIGWTRLGGDETADRTTLRPQEMRVSEHLPKSQA